MTSSVDRRVERTKRTRDTVILRSHKHGEDSECQEGNGNCKLRVVRATSPACW